MKQLKNVSVVNMTPREKLVAKYEAWDPLGLEHRTFVCVGTCKNTEQNHSWVMTFDRSFQVVTFWECRNGLKYVLHHRIKPEEADKMRSYLCPQHDAYATNKEKAFYDLENSGMEKLKKQYRSCKRSAKAKLRTFISNLKKFIVAEDNFNDNDKQAELLKNKQQEIIQELDKENKLGGEEEGLMDDEEQNKQSKKHEKVIGFTNFDQLMENAKQKAMIYRNRSDEAGKQQKVLTRDEIMAEKKKMYEE